MYKRQDKTIVDGIASIAPDEGVLSEEGGKSIPNTKAYWVVDPLDGTTNFAAGIPYWSISVATVSYTHLRAHETRHDIVCRLLLEKKVCIY